MTSGKWWPFCLGLKMCQLGGGNVKWDNVLQTEEFVFPVLLWHSDDKTFNKVTKQDTTKGKLLP